MAKTKAKSTKTKSKKQTATKPRRKKTVQKTDPLNEQIKDIWVLFLFFLAVFTALSIFVPRTTGMVGYWLVDYFAVNLFGEGVKYLPLFLLAGAISLLVTAKKKRVYLVILGLSGGFWAFVTCLEFVLQGNPQAIMFPLKRDGGGLIGIVSAFVLFKSLGRYGSFVFLFVSGVMGALFTLNFTLSNFFRGIQYLFFSPSNLKRWSEFTTKVGKALFYKRVIYRYREQDFGKLRQEPTPPPPPVAPYPPVGLQEPEPKPTLSADTLPKFTPIDTSSTPRRRGNYQFPPLSLLAAAPANPMEKQRAQHAKELASVLEFALDNFNVKAKVVNITPGPSVTRYELKPGEGVKISKITNLSQDIALKMAVPMVRIEAPIPGKALIGIEVPNQSPDMVTLRTILAKENIIKDENPLPVAMGLTITGEPIVMQLNKMPHVLIAGATGSGKSVCLNSIIVSILLKSNPDQVKFLMIDPKKVELSLYQDIPHLLAPVVTNPQKAAATLKQWALVEMERRYDMFAAKGVKTIEGFNKFVVEEKPEDLEELPYIVVVIDELADLMMVASQEVENTICRLAQMARATGIHLVIATQRPSVNVVTGLIKANVPSRVSFAVQSQIDSRTILDMPGAEKLMGKGDMLYMPAGELKPIRAQGVFISEDEVKRVADFVRKQSKPDYDQEILDVEPLKDEKESVESEGDELFDKAKEMVQQTQYVSTSYLQRKLRIGYNRAARLVDELEEKGVVSAYDSERKSRAVL